MIAKFLLYVLYFLPFCFIGYSLPIETDIKASSFFVYPLEEIELKAALENNSYNWKIPSGHLLSKNGNSIIWSSTVKEGIYPIFLEGVAPCYILSFRPNSLVSREQFAYLISLFLPKKRDVENKDLNNISNDHWSNKALSLCMQRGIIQAYPDGSVDPFLHIKKIEAAKMLYEWKRNYYGNIEENNLLPKLVFSDLSQKNWVYSAVQHTIDILPPVSKYVYGVKEILAFKEAREIFNKLKSL